MLPATKQEKGLWMQKLERAVTSSNNRINGDQVSQASTPAILSKFVAGNNIPADLHQAGNDLQLLSKVYLKNRITGLKSPETVRHINSDLENFLLFFKEYFKELEAQKWSPHATREYIDALQRLGRKPSTITRRLISIRAFGRWLNSVREDLLPLGDPTEGVKPPAQEPLRPKGLTDKQVKAILVVAQRRITYRESDHPGRKKDQRPRRDYAILMLLLHGGLRRSEVCGLKLDQIHDAKLINVKCKGNSLRDILIGQETAHAIKAYIESERKLDLELLPASTSLFLPVGTRRRDNVSGTASRTINYIVKSFLKEANALFPADEALKIQDLHPHVFRHTHAYNVLKRSSVAYVQKRLGHKRSDLVVRYAQMPEEDEREILERIESGK